MHMWHEFDPDLLSYKDLCEEFKKELGYFKVKQLLVAGPSGRYYIVEDDTDLTVDTHNILHHLERYHVDVEVASDNEHVPENSDYEVDTSFDWKVDTLSDVEYDVERLQLFEKQRNSTVSDKLEHYKELENGMSFAAIEEARKIMNYYVIASIR
ncbi:hypothetical protein KY290_031493 [Solanum tuberosum]|uniref:Uncharacterized protein n=1 Tax=Solanum tuberosum TaxID=4113 RepID=A0ABQ7U9C1_SOLTU|nr:hypothetical protein KY289_030872 [Solanum tuberosum]KAH0743500.1 hypothetical protein KY290_031493 [Solanum tuberosum]